MRGGSGVVEWKAEALIEAVKAQVASNMEDAVKVVEVDARHRMLSIREPEFGRAYRRVLALYRLKGVVLVGAREVLGAVGIPAGDKGNSYGWWIEMGSRAAAAHPWLRPALLTNLRAVMRLLVGG